MKLSNKTHKTLVSVGNDLLDLATSVAAAATLESEFSDLEIDLYPRVNAKPNNQAFTVTTRDGVKVKTLDKQGAIITTQDELLNNALAVVWHLYHPLIPSAQASKIGSKARQTLAEFLMLGVQDGVMTAILISRGEKVFNTNKDNTSKQSHSSEYNKLAKLFGVVHKNNSRLKIAPSDRTKALAKEHSTTIDRIIDSLVVSDTAPDYERTVKAPKIVFQCGEGCDMNKMRGVFNVEPEYVAMVEMRTEAKCLDCGYAITSAIQEPKTKTETKGKTKVLA